jgi:hypothetical protein
VGITAFVYTANGNAFVRAGEGLSTGGGITAYWNQAANSFTGESNSVGASGPYQTTGPLARSGDYTKIMLGDASSGGNVQIIDGNTGQVLQHMTYGGYIDALAANKDASRYAVCVEPAGIAPYLIILDSSFDEIYQDEAGCLGMTFSADGNTLYRDAPVNNVLYTQSIDMTTFAVTNTANYFSNQSQPYSTGWQAADATGMVYGLNAMNPNLLSTAVFVALDTTASSPPDIPASNDPVQIVRVIDNIGSPQGGDLIRILCTGVDTVSADSVSVTIGGAASTDLTVVQVGSLYLANPTLPNLRLVEVKTPPGTPGLVDVTLSAGGTSDTAAKAFQYAQTSKVFPFSTTPNFLLYDSFRKKLYAAHKDQVEVIDPIAQQVLTPLVPASGKLQNSQFAGLSLSPDGNRLYIADTGANLIHMLDLTHPGTGTSINVAQAIGYHSPLSAGRVFETASGMLIGTDVSGNTPNWVFEINRSSGTGTWFVDTLGNTVSGYAWNSTNKGEYVFISSGPPGLWNDAKSEYIFSANFVAQFAVEFTANEDGTVIAAGGSTLGFQDFYPEIVDFGLNTMGLIEEHFDVPMPTGAPSFFFHPSGAVLYKAGEALVEEGPTPFGGLVEIDDVHQFQPAATLVFPEAFITSYSAYTDHMLATDETGRYFFGVTNSGISMMVLNTIPLSIGNLQPAFEQPGGGQTITIRGSGFQAGAVASLGGTPAATTFVDEDTLTVVVPELTSGWQDVTVTNTNGMSYTFPGALQVLGAQPTPAITGFSPATLTAESNIGGFDQSQTVTILGSGFAVYDTVVVNGLPTDSVFVDASHIQATVPADLTGLTGSISFTVVSPYTDTSNTMSLPMVNPVPIIDYNLTAILNTSGGAPSVWVNGTNFVAASVVQWNGQNLSTYLVQGESAGTGDELVIGAVPAGLLTGSGTASFTVFNPSPGGGTSNAVTLSLSSTPPQVSFPASIDFGRVLMNAPATQTVSLTNTGSANYKMGSVTAGSGPFSAQVSTCGNVSPQSSCNLQVQFLPTAAGAATGTLTIADNTAVSPHTIPMTGTGTPTLAPSVTITSFDVLGQTVQATVNGTTTVGGPAVPAIAWVEYGTDQTLATYAQSAQWGFAGDGTLSRTLYGLSPSTTYAARLVVQTANGTGKSSIRLFATMAAPPYVAFAPATGASNAATVNAGQTATYQLVASDGGNGYTGTATLSCSGAPLGATCTVTPSTLSVGLNGSPFTVTATTTAPSSAFQKSPPGGLVSAFALLLTTAAFSFRKRRYRMGRLICLAAVMMFVLACGGATGSGGGSSPPPPPATPSGTYGLTINASTGGAQNSYLLTLTVK